MTGRECSFDCLLLLGLTKFCLRGRFCRRQKFSVSSRDQYVFAKALVDAGRFPSAGAVLQQGIEFLKKQEADAQADRAPLRVLLQQ